MDIEEIQEHEQQVNCEGQKQKRSEIKWVKNSESNSDVDSNDDQDEGTDFIGNFADLLSSLDLVDESKIFNESDSINFAKAVLKLRFQTIRLFKNNDYLHGKMKLSSQEDSLFLQSFFENLTQKFETNQNLERDQCQLKKSHEEIVKSIESQRNELRDLQETLKISEFQREELVKYKSETEETLKQIQQELQTSQENFKILAEINVQLRSKEVILTQQIDYLNGQKDKSFLPLLEKLKNSLIEKEQINQKLNLELQKTKATLEQCLLECDNKQSQYDALKKEKVQQKQTTVVDENDTMRLKYVKQMVQQKEMIDQQTQQVSQLQIALEERYQELNGKEKEISKKQEEFRLFMQIFTIHRKKMDFETKQLVEQGLLLQKNQQINNQNMFVQEINQIKIQTDEKSQIINYLIAAMLGLCLGQIIVKS